MMRVLLTGATGFIGTLLVPELIEAGHDVIGVSRSDAGAAALARAGAEVLRADVNDLDRMTAAAQAADGVIHAAFNHDFSTVAESSERDRQVITALGAALTGSDRPLVVSSGTGLVARSGTGAAVTETDAPAASAEVPRAATEEAADAIVSDGGRAVVVRLAQVHDTRHQGRISEHVRLAQEHGWVGYLGDGSNRVPAVHVDDAVRLYRLALEDGRPGARYHAVGEHGVALRDIAAVIGTGLGLPVHSITQEQAAGYFGPLAQLAGLDLPAASDLTRRELGWESTGPDLLSDLARGLRGAGDAGR